MQPWPAVELAVRGLACGNILPSFMFPELSLLPPFCGERREAAVYVPPGDMQSRRNGSGLLSFHSPVPDFHRSLKRLPPRRPLLFNNVELQSLHFLHCEGTSWGYSSSWLWDLQIHLPWCHIPVDETVYVFYIEPSYCTQSLPCIFLSPACPQRGREIIAEAAPSPLRVE